MTAKDDRPFRERLDEMKVKSGGTEAPPSKAIDAINAATEERNRDHWIDRIANRPVDEEVIIKRVPNPKHIPRPETMDRFIMSTNSERTQEMKQVRKTKRKIMSKGQHPLTKPETRMLISRDQRQGAQLRKDNRRSSR